MAWIEWCEGSMIQASWREASGQPEFHGVYNDFTDPGHKDPRDFTGDWKNTKLINRAIDIDVLYGHYRQVKWENVNALTYIAKHIFEMMDINMNFARMFPNLKTAHIPLSVNLDKFSFRDRTKTHGKNIAFVHHLWGAKGLPLALQVLKKLVNQDKEWKLFIVGDWSSEAWHPRYITHIIKEMGLEDNVIIRDRVKSVDIFLEEMDYVFSSSYKEAFSLIIGEGMAKGLKPIVHNWQGARDIWTDKYVWTTIDEAVEMCLGDYNSQEYREFVNRYSHVNEYQMADNLIFNL